MAILTMDSNVALTPERPMTMEEFFEREVLLWGFEVIEALLEKGFVIVPNGNNGFTWGFDGDIADSRENGDNRR